MNREELIEVLKQFNEKRVEKLPEKTRNIFYAIMKIADERDRLNNIIEELEKWCNECIDNHIIARENGVTTISDTFFEIVLDKLKELKENNNV